MVHSITMNDERTLSTRDSPNTSDVAVYKTFPVIIKFIEVVVGAVCTGIAAYDILVNFQHLTVRSAAIISAHEFGGIATFLQKAIKPFVNINHVFVDQFTCRIVFAIVAAIFTFISAVQFTWFPKSVSTGGMKTRIISGVIYHATGFALHLAAAVFLLERIARLMDHFYNVVMMETVANVGLAIAALYLLSTALALWYLVANKILHKEWLIAHRQAFSMQPLGKY